MTALKIFEIRSGDVARAAVLQSVVFQLHLLAGHPCTGAIFDPMTCLFESERLNRTYRGGLA